MADFKLLNYAGANGEPVFSKEAIQMVHLYSRGIPRVVNLLCEHSMINAYVDSLRPVPAQLVEEVAREFKLDEIAPVAGGALSSGQQTANTQVLLDNVNEMLGRLRHINATPSRERKS